MCHTYIYIYIYICIYIHIHIMEYYSAIEKNEIFVNCKNMNGLGRHYAKRNKSDRERQILHDITYLWNLKNKTN